MSEGQNDPLFAGGPGSGPSNALPRPAGSQIGAPFRPPWLAAIALSAVFHALWQGHGVLDPSFRNPDVAGIAYNARILAAGGLPYVDSAEIKPPGAFFLFAPFLELGGMRAVWGAAVVWGALLSLATGLLAAFVWGRRTGPRAAVLHAACSVIASDGDINYSFWMATPFTLSAACACGAGLATSTRRALVLWATAGATSMLAVAIKPSAWPVGLVFAVLLARELVLGRSRRAAEGAAAGLTGALSVGLLIGAPYLASGRTAELLGGLDTVARFGNEYVAVVREAAGGRLHAIISGLPCLVEQLPGLLGLAVLGIADLFARGRGRSPLGFVAPVFLVAAFVGTTFTLRFFSHDNAELWPALALIAVRPAGLVGRALDALARVMTSLERVPAVLRAAPVPLVTAVLGLLAALPGFEFRWGYVHYMAERDQQIAAICRELAPRLPKEEPVLAWGWSAWSVYEHCQRRAPGRVFKVIASVTTVNTNTCNNGFGPMALRRDEGPAEFLADVRRRPPSLFLWSSYFKEMGGDPLDDWAALRAFVESRYRVVDARGPFVALLRNDLLPSTPESAHAEVLPSSDVTGSDLYGWSGRAGSVWTSTSRTPENSALMASMTQCVTR
jgi:hypothetical protein